MPLYLGTGEQHVFEDGISCPTSGVSNSERFGSAAVASGVNSTAFAQGAVASGPQSIGIGHVIVVAAGQGIGIGISGIVTSSAPDSIGIGHNHFVSHSNAAVLGRDGASTAADRFTIGTIGGSFDLEVQIGNGLAVWGETPPATRPEITGSRSGATVSVMTQMLTALAATGLFIDSTTT